MIYWESRGESACGTRLIFEVHAGHVLYFKIYHQDCNFFRRWAYALDCNQGDHFMRAQEGLCVFIKIDGTANVWESNA